ncbi:peptidylprolyl isomerase [Halarcobacter mediterraneus]|uniref:Peptidylprolyl isomerase n=1 Tax=Halarcobacter mediterraneus TaxID=2023153 RepID=A0A4Q1ASN7_9BACT|nr:peptidyl-prolyl cis-trans isomerase [Halarcobacter mediterraneus]RXK12693.1 peptidylprolyl isomerase [Halarcobacter mediterraneus]
MDGKRNLFSVKKILLALVTFASLSFAQQLVDAIALVVNDEPITLYDIEKRKAQANISKDKAVSQLIDEVLFDQLVDDNNITADIFDVNNYLEKLAASNGMDLYEFKSIIRQQYKDYAAYEEKTRQLILREKLTNKLVRGNVKVATEEDLKIYYENNKNMFKTASKVKAIQYSSKDRRALEEARTNPMLNIQGVNKAPVDLDQSNLNPQLRYILNETAINKFTPIFTSDKHYVSLFISHKENQDIIAFENVRDRIFNIVMQDREKKYLKDYFEKLKLSADIKIVR